MFGPSNRRSLIDVAMGVEPADIILSNARLINVITRELLSVDITIKDGFVAAVTSAGSVQWSATTTHDLGGSFVAPGFMDPHVHVESSFLTVTEYALAAMQRGVTTIAIDPHEIGNVLGIPGMNLMLEEAKTVPLRVRLRVPGRIPAMPEWLETSGARLDLVETLELLDHPDAVCLAGDINPFLLIAKDSDQLEKIAATRAKRMTVAGQTPGLRGRELNAFVAAGPEDSHVAASVEEIVENQRLGLRSIVALRRALLHRPQLRGLAARIQTGLDTRYLQFCTDDVNAHELLDVGHLDTRIRIAIEEGMNPFVAYQMATINVAEGLRIDHDFGAITPGRAADLVVIGDMKDVDVTATMIGGLWVHGPYGTFVLRQKYAYPDWACRTMQVGPKFTGTDMRIAVADDATEATVLTIRSTIPKKSDRVTLPVREGVVQPDPAQQVSSIVIVDRHQASRRIGRGFVSGFFVRSGAVASTISHDAHNLMVIGADFDDMALAANRAVENGGGYAIALNGQIIFEMALPIAGLMSTEPIETVAAQARQLVELLHDRLGVPRTDDQVLHQLNFLPLPNIPDYGFTDFGLIASDDLNVLEVITGVAQSSCGCGAKTP